MLKSICGLLIFAFSVLTESVNWKSDPDCECEKPGVRFYLPTSTLLSIQAPQTALFLCFHASHRENYTVLEITYSKVDFHFFIQKYDFCHLQNQSEAQ